jgi:hypothetical protein
MSFQGPVIENLSMRRSGLWAGLGCSGATAAGLLLVLAVRPGGGPKGCAAAGLWLFTALLGLAFYTSAKELFFRLPVIRVPAEGLAFRISSGGGYWDVPWPRVKAIRLGENDVNDACLDIELDPDPANPMPSLRLNASGGAENTLRFNRGNLAGDLALTAARLEAYRRSFTEGG